ncbi:helix-turn-helix domain-containing protein [Candidatus Woesearchaeota archaeon]|nr:helix-turn-helix domain-containing protein [Candidatus Woesearchaeota archaeon]
MTDLETVVKGIEEKANADIIQVHEQSARLKGREVLKEGAAQSELFTKLIGGVKLLSDQHVLDDLAYFHQHGEKGVADLPSRFRDRVKENLGKLPAELLGREQAKAYLLDTAQGLYLMLPFSEASQPEFYARAVEPLKALEGFRQVTYPNGCSGAFAISVGPVASRNITREIESKLQCEPYSPLKVRRIATGEITLDTGHQYTLDQVLELLSTSKGKLYRVMSELKIQPVMEDKRRIFPEEQFNALRDHYRENVTERNPSPDSLRNSGRWYTVRQAAQQLELSEDSIRFKLRTGDLSGHKYEGLWYVAVPSVRKFKSDHIRFDMRYTKRRLNPQTDA